MIVKTLKVGFDKMFNRNRYIILDRNISISSDDKSNIDNYLMYLSKNLLENNMMLIRLEDSKTEDVKWQLEKDLQEDLKENCYSITVEQYMFCEEVINKLRKANNVFIVIQNVKEFKQIFPMFLSYYIAIVTSNNEQFVIINDRNNKDKLIVE